MQLRHSIARPIGVGAVFRHRVQLAVVLGDWRALHHYRARLAQAELWSTGTSQLSWTMVKLDTISRSVSRRTVSSGALLVTVKVLVSPEDWKVQESGSIVKHAPGPPSHGSVDDGAFVGWH
jgi:hypothetical protein